MMATAAARIAAASRSATATTVTTDATTTPAATVTGESLGIAPDQGDADHREEDRDAEQQSTIHPNFLQQTGTYQKLKRTGRPSRTIPPPDGRQRGGTFLSFGACHKAKQPAS
ncbi:MAG TPA: hypothetical protein VG826_32885 [Pirellulales bacterium]|nr:hypothetical protein [Pirellulales bacterium]